MKNLNIFTEQLKNLSIENQSKAIDKLINYLCETDNQDNLEVQSVCPLTKN